MRLSIDYGGEHRRAELILHGIEGAAPEAMARAINRGMEAGKAEANRQIRQRYTISAKNLDKKIKIRRATANSEGELKFSGPKVAAFKFTPKPSGRTYVGRKIPVPISFGTEPGGKDKWRMAFANAPVSVMEAKETGYRTGPKWFIATFQSGHTGIFKRTEGKTESGKPKLEEIWGYSVADMLDYEPAREAVENRISEVIGQRTEHEIGRVPSRY